MKKVHSIPIFVAVVLLFLTGTCFADGITRAADALAIDIPGGANVFATYIPEYGTVYVIQASKSSVGMQIAQMHPELALYYFWGLHSHEFLSEDQYITLIFRTTPEIQVTSRNVGFTGDEFSLNEMKHAYLRVAGEIVTPSPESLAKAVDQLVTNGQRWLSEFDSNRRAFLGRYPDDDPAYLDQAEQFLQISLAIDKDHQSANSLTNQVNSLRTAFLGYKEATDIISTSERSLKKAVESGDEEMKAVHSFRLWNAYDLLVSVLEHNPNHDRARESFSKLSALLSSHPRISDEELIALQKVAEEEYKRNSRRIDYAILNRDAVSLKGEKVSYRGKVLQSQVRSQNTVLRIDTGSGDVIWAEFAGQINIYEGDRLEFWGEVDGIETYRSVAGWRISVPRVKVKHFSVTD